MTEAAVAVFYTFWANERAAIAKRFSGGGHHPMQKWCGLE
jgi:hypothetical protein